MKIKPFHIFLCILCVAIIISGARRIYEHQRDKTLLKIYKTTPWIDKTTKKETTQVGGTSAIDLDTTNSIEDETGTLSESDPPVVSDSSLPRREDEFTNASEKPENSGDDERTKAEQIERQAALQKRFAETDALLEEANTIVVDGKASLDQAGTALANYLNTLSREEQVAFALL